MMHFLPPLSVGKLLDQHTCGGFQVKGTIRCHRGRATSVQSEKLSGQRVREARSVPLRAGECECGRLLSQGGGSAALSFCLQHTHARAYTQTHTHARPWLCARHQVTHTGSLRADCATYRRA